MQKAIKVLGEKHDMYQLIDKLHTLYGLLQDERSKEIFQARFAIDMEKSFPNIQRLVSLASERYEATPFLGWPKSREILKKLNQERKKIVLYGTGAMGLFFCYTAAMGRH